MVKLNDVKECIWHNADEELPEIEKEVIVIYDNGYLCYNHRPNPNSYMVRPNGEKSPYKPLVTKNGWCDFSKSITNGHKIICWTECPVIEEEEK